MSATTCVFWAPVSILGFIQVAGERGWICGSCGSASADLARNMRNVWTNLPGSGGRRGSLKAPQGARYIPHDSDLACQVLHRLRPLVILGAFWATVTGCGHRVLSMLRHAQSLSLVLPSVPVTERPTSTMSEIADRRSSGPEPASRSRALRSTIRTCLTSDLDTKLDKARPGLTLDYCVQLDEECPDDGTGLKITVKTGPPALQFFDYTTPAN